MRHFLLPLALSATPALADVPNVVADIAPIHAIAARVMEGVGTPSLIIPPGASPHGYAMRPSEARAIAGADMIVWVGHGLTPWLEEPLEALGDGVPRIELIEAPGMELLSYREGESFAAHDHGDHAGHDAHDAHDAKEEDDEHEGEHDHAEDDHKHEDEHSHSDEAHADGDHDLDPHIWLDPQNGIVIANVIAARLAALNPENAATYQSNASAFATEITTLSAEIGRTVAPSSGKAFIVFHDAFHYFEHRFDIEARASVSAGDAAKPGAARVAAVQSQAREVEAVCAFAEPEMNASLLNTITQGLDTRIATLDPLGAGLDSGPAFYADLLRGLANNMAACLTPSG